MIGQAALIPNPALARFAVLIGLWRTEGFHSMIPGVTLRGQTSFEWAEGGAFVVMRSEIDDAQVPNGVCFIGSDDDLGELFMLYFDERGVSRKYDVSMRDNVFRFWRDAPSFRQRFAFTIIGDGSTMQGKGELSRDNSTWDGDLELTCVRDG